MMAPILPNVSLLVKSALSQKAWVLPKE